MLCNLCMFTVIAVKPALLDLTWQERHFTQTSSQFSGWATVTETIHASVIHKVSLWYNHYDLRAPARCFVSSNISQSHSRSSLRRACASIPL